jgi:uncharacterized membrane protein YbhN (UPF0104 family)
MPKRLSWRPYAAIVVLLVTVVAFLNYFGNHPEIENQLRSTSPSVLFMVLGLYLIFMGCLALVNMGTLRLCKSRLSSSENLLLTMYSSIINFFGPLQSGPAFRAIYLKQKHGVKFKAYTRASIAYYFFYGLFSGLFMVSGLLGWWLLPAIFIAICGLFYARGRAEVFLGGNRWQLLALASLLQVCVLAIIFYVELKAVAPSVHLGQVIVYTGVANLALFVSITPGAIGFRESFLVFTEKLHHIDGPAIVAANLIDRSIYIVMLLLLVAAIFGSHANRRFKLAKTAQS